MLARGIEVVAADCLPDLQLPGAFAIHQIPTPDDPSLLSVLRRLVADYRVALLVPTVDAELPSIAAGRAGFDSDVEVIVAGPGPVSIVQDKLFSSWRLRARGVAVPRFGTPADFTGSAAAFEALGAPLVVRSRFGRGDGPWVLERAADLDWVAVPADAILQEFAPGAEYTAVAYRPAGPRYAEPLIAVLERESRMDDSETTEPVVRVPSSPNRDVATVAVAAVRALGLVGPVSVDLRRMADGSLVVLDAKARFSDNSWLVPELLDRVLGAAERRRSALRLPPLA